MISSFFIGIDYPPHLPPSIFKLDTLDTLDTLDSLDTLDTLYTLDTSDTLDILDTLDTLNTLGTLGYHCISLCVLWCSAWEQRLLWIVLNIVTHSQPLFALWASQRYLKTSTPLVSVY